MMEEVMMMYCTEKNEAVAEVLAAKSEMGNKSGGS